MQKLAHTRAAQAARVSPKMVATLLATPAAALLAVLPAKAELSSAAFSTALPAVDLTSLSASDPLVVGGAVAVLSLLGLGAISTLGAGPSAKATPAAQALQALTDEPRALLIDIRPKAEAKAEGAPELKATKKRLLALPFTVVEGEATSVVEGFAEAAAKLPGLTADTLVVLLDGAGAEGAAAGAALLAAEGFPAKQVYYVAGGAAAWRAGELPWREPAKLSVPSLSLPSLPSLPGGVSIDALTDAYKANPSAVTAGAAVLAIAGTATFAIQEFELLAQLAGLFAVGQFAVRNVLFADDREKTISSFNSFVKNTEADVAAEELKKLASTILESATAEIAVAAIAGDAKQAAAGEPSTPAEARASMESYSSSNASNN